MVNIHQRLFTTTDFLTETITINVLHDQAVILCIYSKVCSPVPDHGFPVIHMIACWAACIFINFYLCCLWIRTDHLVRKKNFSCPMRNITIYNPLFKHFIIYHGQIIIDMTSLHLLHRKPFHDRQIFLIYLRLHLFCRNNIDK